MPSIRSLVLVAALLAVTAADAHARPVLEQRSQSGDRVILLRPEGVTSKAGPAVAVPESQAKATADAFLAEQGPRVGLADPAGQLTHVRTHSDKLGLSHVVYHQEHLGLPVRNASVRVHVNQAGEVYLATPKVVTDLPGDGTPLVTAEAANETAEREARGLLPAFADVAAEFEEPRLVWLPTESGTQLVWEAHAYFSKCGGEECPALGAYVNVNAQTGAVVNAVHDFHGLDRRVYDCAKQPSDVTCYIDSPGIPPYIHGRSNAAPVRGPHNNPALPQFGSTDVDEAHDYALAIHDWTQTSFGLDGANNRGGIRDKVGEQSQSRYYVHAEGWDEQQVSFCPGSALISGTQSIVFCHDEVFEDVVGHEYSHSIVNWGFTASGGDIMLGPDLGNTQTRALDESHSDVMGEVYESDRLGVADWINGTGSAVPATNRDLTDPNSSQDASGNIYAQRFYDQHVNCDTDPATGGYYENSTIYSHAFYLLSEGGAFNGCDVAAQGTEVAKQVFHRAWRTYFDRSQNFDGAYTLLLQSCADLYGLGSAEYVNFQKALQSVEANQAEAPYGGGICVDPLRAAGEQAPPCAVSHGGTVQSARFDGTPATTFAVGEGIWLTHTAATPDRDLDFVLLPKDPARPIWQDLAGAALDQSTATVLPDGTLFTQAVIAGAAGTYDVVVDGNQDGIYQPWADVTLTVEVSAATSSPVAAIPAGPIVQSVRPNPFGTRTTFSLGLRKPSDVRLVVYDLAGRVVREVMSAARVSAGMHEVVWDGRDGSGSPVPSGIYMYRLESGEQRETGKLTVLK